MRTGIKILLIFIVFLVYGAIQVIVQGGNANSNGVGGPVGIVLTLAFFAGAVAIWKYNPQDEKGLVKKDDDENQLNKN